MNVIGETEQIIERAAGIEAQRALAKVKRELLIVRTNAHIALQSINRDDVDPKEVHTRGIYEGIAECADQTLRFIWGFPEHD
jgi:hypothetical protein